MILEKDFLVKLKDFGLNSYEAKLWTALLSRGVSTAGELSDIAHVPRSRTYDVLESLERKGFIIMKLGKPIKYLAVDPSEVVSRIKKQIHKDTETQLKMLDELDNSPVLDELSLLHKQGIDMVTPSDLAGSFRNRDALYSQIDTMIRSAESSVTILSSEEEVIRKMVFLKRHMLKAIERGVHIRIAGPISQTNPLIEELTGSGVEIRYTTDISARFVVVDSCEVLFMLLDDKEVHPNFDVGIWVNTPLFAGALQGLFNLAWDKMKPLVQVK